MRRMTADEYQAILRRAALLSERLGIDEPLDPDGKIAALVLSLLEVYCSGAGIRITRIEELRPPQPEPEAEGGGT